MSRVNKIVERYSKFVSFNAALILVIVSILTVGAIIFAGNVGTKSQDNSDMIPDEYDTIRAFEIIEDSFGGSDSIMIAVEIDPDYPGSNEKRDIRDPEVIRYISLLSQLAEHTDDVTGVDSVSTVLVEMNEGILPKSKREIYSLVESSPVVGSYMSSDYTLAVIKIRLTDQYDAEDLVKDLDSAIHSIQNPAGITAQVAGNIAAEPIVMEQINPDMQKTSNFSMIGIAIVLLLLFMSVRFAVTPLLVIGLGIMWAFGFMGLINADISPATSGAVSMIMGIGIDFGIQIITRFRQELPLVGGPRRAMEVALNHTIIPMATTTVAALIGFKAMSMGELTIMQELATIMSYGVTTCFLAAITVVPIVAIMGEQWSVKFKSWFNDKFRKKKRSDKISRRKRK